MAAHRCPYCRSRSMHRSRHSGFGERCLLRAQYLRPHRCWSCYRRHYRFAFLLNNPTFDSAYASLLHVRLQPASLAAGLLSIVLFLGSSGANSASLGLANSAGVAGPESSPDAHSPRPPSSDARSGTLSRPETGRTIVPDVRMRQLPVDQASSEQAVLLRVGLPASPQRPPLGSLKATGEVFLNGYPVPQVATIFAEDTLRTGGDGNAILEFPGKGIVAVSPQTLMRLTRSSRYIADLSYGRITSRSLPGATNFQVRAGNFIMIPDPERPEMTAEIVRALDGSIVVKAVQGSVGIVELEGPQTTFIRNGNVASISVDGKLLTSSPPQTLRALPPQAVGTGKGQGGGGVGGEEKGAAKGGGGHGALIGLGLGGGAAAGVGIALASGGQESAPISPSAP